uniref:Ribosomal protein n=1 Tax=Alexandrium monilatum TaxID=311494 RepID=A0A7S4RNM0_9DINO
MAADAESQRLMRRSGRPSGRAAAALLLAAAAAAVFLTFTPAFLPPPMDLPVPQAASKAPAAAERDSGDGLAQWWEETASVDLPLLGAKLRRGMDQGVRGAAEALAGIDKVVRGLDQNPQLLPVGAGQSPEASDAASAILEPVTKLYMKYMHSIKPRCKDCQLVIRWGRVWRLCKTRRHLARQPGTSHYKRKIHRHKGFKTGPSR